MWIFEALRGVQTLERTSSTADVTGVQYDSRKVGPGDIFVAMRGGSTDGNRYIATALERGASAIVTDSRAAFEQIQQVPRYLVENGRRALAGIAANLLDNPQQKLKVSAVTGTNGKTTTAFLLEQLLRSVGRKCVLIGTIETHIADEVRPSEHTTPEASDLLRIFADGVKAGCTEVVMEMSSHALDQERVWGVHVDVAIFTNLTQDHLDYHGTMEEYGAAKAKLFQGVGSAPPRISVLNVDDAFGAELAQDQLAGSVMTYGVEQDGGQYVARKIRLGYGQTIFELETPEGQADIYSSLTGRVNVYNLTAAACAARARGLTWQEIARVSRTLKQVPGRLETVPAEGGITVVVDYAHTDDALKKLIEVARETVGRAQGRVITVFGCGGDRDKTKRPKMGRVAGQGSDVVVVTSDNPRTEDPSAIIEDVLVGVRETSTKCFVEPDRTAAIKLAITHAKVGDIVLLAGKGHEKVQILYDRTVPFDDVAVATAIVKGTA